MKPTTVRQWLKDAASKIAASDASTILCYSMNLSDRAMLVLHYDDAITAEQLQQINTMVSRRRMNEPLAYIIGHKEFYSMNFKVTKAVLIPRPDSEIIVDLAIKYGMEKLQQLQVAINSMADQYYNIIDLGTGSGCLLIAIVKSLLSLNLFPRIAGTGVDISFDALMVAKENIEHNYLQENCNLVLSDFFQNINNQDKNKFDLIISNPPYIAKNELPDLMPDVSRYEPLHALSDMNDGLSHYRTIISQLHKYLADDGVAILEHGYMQKDEIKDIVCKYGRSLEAIEEATDLQGNARAIVLKLVHR